MDGALTTPHDIVNPPELAPAKGFAHAVAAAPGRHVFLGGQTAHDADGRIASHDLVEQFDAACRNIVTALAAVDARPDHLVSIQIFTTEPERYRRVLGPLGDVWRRRFGSHYPATSWFAVSELFDPAAKVEVVAVAVVPP